MHCLSLLQAAKGILEESKSKLEDEKSACENKIQRLQGRLEGKEEDMNKKQVAKEDDLWLCADSEPASIIFLMLNFVDKS